MDLVPDFSQIEFYQKELKETFNHNYEKVEIEESLNLLLGQEIKEEEVLVYPDDHINGI